MEILMHSPADVQAAAHTFAQQMGQARVFALYGPMGAGKTTFVRALCAELGVRDVVNSPTFALVNEYACANGGLVYHFDFYRLRSVAEAYDMGFEEYADSGHYCFIEWPELVEPLLPPDAVRVHLDVLPTGARRLVF